MGKGSTGFPVQGLLIPTLLIRYDSYRLCQTVTSAQFSLRVVWVPSLKIKSLGNFGIDSSFTKWITKSFWFKTQNANEHEWFDWTYVDYWFSRKSKAERYRPGFHALLTRTKLTIAIGPLIEDLTIRWSKMNLVKEIIERMYYYTHWWNSWNFKSENLNWNKTLKFRPGLGISDFQNRANVLIAFYMWKRTG